MSKKENILMKTTLSVTIVIMLSKGIGFIREMIMAYYFGRDMVTDAYNSAYSLFYLPVLLFSSCITSTLVPLYIHKNHTDGRIEANRAASNTLNLFIAFSVIISAVMMIFAPSLVSLVYPGFADEAFTLTVKLTRIMMPALAFFVAGIVLSTLLNAQEHYLAAQLTGFPLSIALITAAVFFSDASGIQAQAWGIVAAGVLQIVILLPSLRKDYRYSPVFEPGNPDFKHLMALAVPAVLSMAANELNHMIDRMLASSLNPGDISAMAYAFKLVMFMMGVLVVPLTTISFSKMSKQAANDNPAELIPHVRSSVCLLAGVVLPITAIAAAASTPIIRLAYGRGQFGESSVLVTGVVFMFYVIGVPLFGLRDLLSRVYHALQNTKTTMIVTFIAMTCNIVFNIILRPLMGVNGLAFATTIAALISVALLTAGLMKSIRGLFDKSFYIELIKTVFASGICLAVALLISNLLPEPFGVINLFIHLIAVTASSLIAYAAACIVLKVSLFRSLKKIIRR
ncbi:MAG: murein biosynthesis integral membrane protein MurJ [Clostridia bacterium]|nr:murein biosynthesis integral membrane protein MurJ [Clostridia bacterium]